MSESRIGSSDLTDELAAYAVALKLDHAPEGVQRQVHLCILDTIGCVVAGSAVEDWKPLMEAEMASGTSPQSTVIGTRTRLSAEAAARVNAYMGDIFELNDLIGGHASIGNVTGLMALAEARNVTGKALVGAVAVGLEVTARVYAGYYPSIKSYDDVGIAPVAFPSAYGVAAGAARLLGLTEEQTSSAMGIAGSLVSWCPAEVVFGDGGTVKPMLFGSCPATAGILGARYALAGMTGPRRLLEGSRGHFSTAARKMFPDAVRDRTTWHVAAPRRKVHAACGYTHSPLDTVIELRRAGARFDLAEEIRIDVCEFIVPAISKSDPPATANQARFHLQYCAALAALGEDVILPEHSINFQKHIARPAVQALMRKFSVVSHPRHDHYHSCKVTLLDGNGSDLEQKEGKAPKGSPQNQMGDTEVVAKFRRLAEHRLRGPDLDRYVTMALQLDRCSEWRWLVSAFDENFRWA
jgi:2-methylcitrate dehydratase PrpD